MFFEWFIMNLKIGALSFGSSGRIMMYQEAVVDEKKWLTKEEFFEIITVAQVLPGPILVNLVIYLSYRLFHQKLAALIGLLALAMPGAILAVLLYTILPMNNIYVARLFQGFSLGSVAISLVFILGIMESIGITHKPQFTKKLIARILLLVSVLGSSLLGFPLFLILIIGITVGFFIEFLL